MATDWTPSSGVTHEMVCEAELPTEALFVCTDAMCGRRVVVGKVPPRLTVIDKGDFAVRHVGGTGGITMRDVAVR
jgi:hypothetical protein